MHRIVMLVVRAEMARRQRLTAVCRLAASVLDARARAVSQDRLAVRDIPEQVSALVDNAAGPVGEDKEFAGALLRLLAAAYEDAGRDTVEIPSAEAVPVAAEVLRTMRSPRDEEVPDDGHVPEAERGPPGRGGSQEDEEILQDREEESRRTRRCRRPRQRLILRPRLQAIWSRKCPERSRRPRLTCAHSSRPGRPRRRRVLGLAAAILILLGAGAGGVTLALTQAARRWPTLRPHRRACPRAGPDGRRLGSATGQPQRDRGVRSRDVRCP